MTKTSIDVVLQFNRAIIIVAIGTISILAWSYILWLAAHTSMLGVPAVDSTGMAGMDMPAIPMPPGSMSGRNMAGVIAVAEPAFRPWGIAHFAFVFIMWAVMMVGMMTPSVAPMVLLYATVGRKAAASGRSLPATAWFLGGYLSAWIAFSLAATGVQWILTRLALLSPMMESTSGIFPSSVLIVAGLYQWSPLKNTCLKQCQTPLGFLMRRGGFRSEPFGALRLGARAWFLLHRLLLGTYGTSYWRRG